MEAYRDAKGLLFRMLDEDHGKSHPKFAVINADDPAGDYLGGSIAPGMLISLQALVSRAAKLSLVDPVAPPSVIGHSTTQAMQSGLVFGYVGLIEGIVARMTAELGDQTRVVATGGLAEVLAPLTTAIHHVDQRLTLDGLRIIHELNS